MSRVRSPRVAGMAAVLMLFLSSIVGCGADDSLEPIHLQVDPGKAEIIKMDDLVEPVHPQEEFPVATCAGADEFSSSGVDLETMQARNDLVTDAVALPDSVSSRVEIEAFDLYAPGANYPEGDVDWYKMVFTNDFQGTAFSVFNPYAALYMEGTHFGYADEKYEVCVFVTQKDQALHGDFQCWGALEETDAITEGDLVGCCTTEPGPSGNGGQFDVGEAVLNNSWDLASGESIPMYVRVRSLGQSCQHYRLIYGHFRG